MTAGRLPTGVLAFQAVEICCQDLSRLVVGCRCVLSVVARFISGSGCRDMSRHVGTCRVLLDPKTLLTTPLVGRIGVVTFMWIVIDDWLPRSCCACRWWWSCGWTRR